MESSTNFVQGIRYNSETKFFGIPFVSIAMGPDIEKGEVRGHAKGIIAIGDIATGCLAIGGIARGVVALGGLSVGIISSHDSCKKQTLLPYWMLCIVCIFVENGIILIIKKITKIICLRRTCCVGK
jgi:hypothetical protein